MKKQHKITLLVIGILLAFCLCISASYALYIFSVGQESSNVVNTDCFDITFEDSNPISISEGIPLRDSEALELEPYTFTIKNICNHPLDYDINIETLDSTTMDLNGVRVRFGNSKSIDLGSIEDNDLIVNKNAISSKTINRGSLKGNDSKTFDLRVYIGEESTMEQSMNKKFSSKIVVSASINPTYSEAITLNGREFNAAIKGLAGGGEYSTYVDENITAIKWSDYAPTENDTVKIVSGADSEKEIYAWFNNGTIYLYSEADKIYIPYTAMRMFYQLSNLTEIDLSRFDTSRVTDMNNMFASDYALTELDLSNFDTSNVTNMNCMFYSLKNIKTLDVSSFDTSSVTDFAFMFSGMKELTALSLGRNFNTSSGEYMYSMFGGLTSLPSLDLGDEFNTSNVINMNNMFSGLNGITELNLGDKFDTSKVTNMSGMFSGLNLLTSLDLGNKFNTSSVTNMNSMFKGAEKLTKLNLGDLFDTSKVTDMLQMFCNLKSLDNLDLKDKFDTSSAVDMKGMFMYYGGKQMNLGNKFNCKSATNIRRMFYGAYNLEYIDLSYMETANVSDAIEMFQNASKLKTIYASSSFDLSNTTDKTGVFNNCKSLVGGAGTSYDTSRLSGDYARIDDPDNGKPGYFTYKTR